MVNHTKERIVKSFNLLLETTTLEKISVEMIINQSGISKSTFYRNFKDKFDVMNYNYQVLIDSFIQCGLGNSWKDLYCNIFKFAEVNIELLRNAFKTSGINSFENFIYAYSYSVLENSYLKYNNITSLLIKTKYEMSFFCSGCVDLLKQWVFNNMNMPIEEISQIAYNFMPESMKPMRICAANF